MAAAFRPDEKAGFGRINALSLSCVALIAVSLSACSTNFYPSVPAGGKFMGVAYLEWKNQHEFVFHQNRKQPFYFERPNGDKIIPKSMYTDGGSIPRVLWGFSGYSPWEYGPAFLIHDWIFIAHHCHEPGYEHYDVNEAADVMAECMKALMEKDPPVVKKDIGRIYRMNLAVRSAVAKRIWKEEGCPQQPPDIITEQVEQSSVELKRRARVSQPMKFKSPRPPVETKAPLPERAADTAVKIVPAP